MKEYRMMDMKAWKLLAPMAILWVALASESHAQSKQAKVASAPPKPWTAEPETVLGIRMGLPIGESPIPECPEKSWSSADVCYKREKVLTHYPAEILGHGIKYAIVNMNEDDGVVYSITLSFKQFHFEEFQSMLESKYGNPTSQETSQVQNGAGAKFSNRTLYWTGQRTSITFVERLGKVDDSMIIFSDNVAAARQIQRRLDRAKESGSKL